MKIIFIILALASFVAGADSDVFDRTYPRDNSFCRVDDDMVELKLRGFDQYTQTGEGDYGDRLFIIKGKKKTLVQMNDDGIGRYKILRGESPNCHKVLSLPVRKNELAIFLAKENRPFNDTLTILYFNFRSGDHEVINTNHPVSQARLVGGKLYFRLKGDECSQKTGFVSMRSKTYTYTEKEFEPWIAFDGRKFDLDKKKTFLAYGGNEYLLNTDSFFEMKGESKKVIFAVNEKSRCISFNHIDWKCI